MLKKIFNTKYSDMGISLATLILRLALGGLMLHYGYNKFMHFGEKSATFPDPFHIGHASSLVLVIFSEFFCSIFIMLGLFTRFACIPLISTMAVVVFHVNHGKIFGDNENAALYLAGFIALFFTGPGKISMDRMIGK
jgi:putative oxidoreductase